MRILLADDQPHIRSALRLLLDQEPNLNVVGEAIDAETLCTQIQVTQPDLLLLDWELPGWPETDLLAILRFLYPRLLIIALSGQIEAREAALSAGVDFFVSKCHPPAQLLSTLRAAQHRYGYNQNEPPMPKKEEAASIGPNLQSMIAPPRVKIDRHAEGAQSINRPSDQPATADESQAGLPFWCRNSNSDLENTVPGFIGSTRQSRLA